MFARWLFGTRVGRTNFFRIVWPNLLSLALSGACLVPYRFHGQDWAWWPGALFLILFYTPIPMLLRDKYLGFPELLEAED